MVITNDYNEAVVKYPYLSVPFKDGEIWCILGKIEIVTGTYLWDTFDIKIKFPKEYPLLLPELYEVGNKIPRHINFHISKDGSCCLGTPCKLYRELSGHISLLRWLDIHVVPFLANQIHKREKGYFVNGESAHYAQGILDDYQELFNTTDINVIYQRFKFILGLDILPRNHNCFCGSNKKYKKCYMLNHEEHKFFMPPSIIESDFFRIKAYVNNPSLLR